MHRFTRSSRLVFALVATSFYLAVLATGGWLILQAGATQPQRPAPDAKVRVVKAPAEPVVDRMPCPTCEMGGPGRRI